MRRYIILLVAVVVSVSRVSASDYTDVETRQNARGVLFNRDIMSVAEMGSIVQSPFQYGTARSMALAGAMTSLGADGASMLTNPAGLGMYRNGDLTITPMVTIQSAKNEGGVSYGTSSNTSFGLSNFTTAINLYESGSTKLISLTLGLGYNQIANLNYTYSVADEGSSSSISRLFSRQLTAGGITLSDLKGNNYPDWNASNIGTNIWGAILGYKMGLTNTSTDDDDDSVWSSTWLSDDTIVDQYNSVESSGSIGEYAMALGGNISNKLYFGVTLGIQSVKQEIDLIYGEEYSNNTASPDKLYSSNYNQTIKMSGRGVNVKFGVTYRPVEALRIGVAYHTPTYYAINRDYQASVASYSRYYDEDEDEFRTERNIVDSPLLQDRESDRWKFRSPSRMLIGASYTFAKRALISVDYQRDDYSNTTVRDLPTGVDESLYSGLNSIYRATNTLRVGAEMKLAPAFALRGGYGYCGSALRSDVASVDLLDIPTTTGIKFFSAGVGFSPNAGVTLDLTYMNQTTDYSTYTLFYADGVYSDLTNTAASASSKSYKTKIKQHNIALSLVLKI